MTDALKKLAAKQSVYAYNFEGRRYDVGDKQGFLEANIEFALKRPDMRSSFLAYMGATIGPTLAHRIETIYDESRHFLHSQGDPHTIQ